MSHDAPHFELRRITVDGDDDGDAEIYPVLGLPGDATMDRRGFLGAGLTIGGALAGIAAIGGCSGTPGRDAEVTASPTPAPSPAPDVADSDGDAPAAVEADAYRSPVARCDPKVIAHRELIVSLATSPDGRWLATGDWKGKIKLWRLPAGTPAKRIGAHDKPVRGLAFSSDSLRLASTSDDGKLGLWRVADGKSASPSRKRVASGEVRVASGGTYLAVAETKKRGVQLLSWPDAKPVTRLAKNKPGAVCVAISSDGQWLAAAFKDHSIEVWRLADRTRQLTLSGHTNTIKDLAFSADGRWLASASYDKKVRVWSLPDGTARGSPATHADKVVSVAFSPDSRTLASASTDRTLKLWSLPALSLQRQLKGHGKGYLRAVFSPDGRWLISASNDKTIRLWSLPHGALENCLYDKTAVATKDKAMQFTAVNAYGETITYTLPCGSPIPPGAICTCNCVPGAYVPTAKPKKKSRSRSYGGSYCSCNKVCTCVPVYYCQAHRLLDDDPAVRRMAEQMVLVLGAAALDYLRWAASTADGRLRARIADMVDRVTAGEAADRAAWPSADTLASYLYHAEPVTALMAAQLTVQQASDGGVDGPRLARARRLLHAGRARHLAVRDRVQAFVDRIKHTADAPGGDD